MTDCTLTASRRSERLLYVGLAVGRALWGAFVGWLSFGFGMQIAQNESRPAVIIIVQPATP